MSSAQCPTLSIEPKGWGTLVLLLLLTGVAGAQVAPDGLATISRETYAGELEKMGELVKACRGQVSACDVNAVPKDARVAGEGDTPEFEVRWEWLRAALRKGAGVKAEVDQDEESSFEPKQDRTVNLDRAAARLTEDLAEVHQGSAAVESDEARRKMDEVLARREFGQVQDEHWWERALGKVYGRVEDWWGQIKGSVPYSPWMGLAFEWGVLGAAAAGLIVWALRLGKQQRVSFATEREVSPAWQAESDDWAAKAKAEAAKGEWREAVHCLYWSAILMLEGQKLWRQNRARTPREYVGLLEPGSARRKVLGGLTTVFERIWYGIRPATGEDYDKASRLLDELRVG